MTRKHPGYPDHAFTDASGDRPTTTQANGHRVATTLTSGDPSAVTVTENIPGFGAPVVYCKADRSMTEKCHRWP